MNAGAHRARFAAIERYVAGRRVLDVGCASGVDRPDWLHALIGTVADELVGVDVDPGAVDEATTKGYDVRLADACAFDLGRSFDVVFAGELIEHLDDPRGFLGSARRHLREDSELVLTTPNAFCFTNFAYRLRRTPAKINRDHVAWYCEDTLRQLLERNGYVVRELHYLRHETPGRIRHVLSRLVRAVLPERLAWNTVLVVAQVRPA